MDDHLFEFEPRPGRIRHDDGRTIARGQGLGRQIAQRGGLGSAMRRRASAKASKPAGAPGRCSRIGRGQDVANILKRRAAGQAATARRVVVKARIVRLKPASQAAAAHLRYLARDGVDRDTDARDRIGPGGGEDRLYGPGAEAVDAAAFTERGRDDRHQFRFIIAPEDGAELADLRSFTRELMAQVQRDLGTRLDWIAVDHFNTGHPHSHVVVRGRDDRGGDLIIAQDYIIAGLRHRAQDLVTLELGPQSELDLLRRRTTEIAAERFTALDRDMLSDLDPERRLDLRGAPGQVRADPDQSLRLQRLKTLERMVLAEQTAPGRWALAEDLEATLQAMGARGDIIRTMSRALSRRGQVRPMETLLVGDPDGVSPHIGQVIDKRLVDELDDRIGLVVDGLDGRVRHVPIDGDQASEIPIGAVIEVAPKPSVRPADRTIAALAQDHGLYLAQDHRQRLQTGTLPLPAGVDPEDLVDAHLRRLEALRRAGVVERVAEGVWRTPPDFIAQVEALEAGRARQAQVRLLSALDLERQIDSAGATWLDRQLLSPSPLERSPHGFGGAVERALARREAALTIEGHASRTLEGELRLRRNLLLLLERRELEQTGAALAQDKTVPFRLSLPGDALQGRLTGSVQLASGKYAVLENCLEFALVPWRPVLQRHLGQEIGATLERGGGVSWSFGRDRGLGL